MKFDDGIPAIPLWIDGHACSGVFEEFIDVRETDGGIRYRVPQCGPDEAAVAVASARRAQPALSDREGRQRLLGELGGLLDQFAGDFARLLSRETGQSAEMARAEIERAVAVLRQADCVEGGGGVRRLASDREQPLFSVADGLARALAAGNAVIVLTTPEAPSAVFALAELSARAGFPAGAFGLLHGDARAGAALDSALRQA